MKKILLLAAFLPGFAFAQDVLTPELLWKLGRVSGGSVSPDGKNILYGVSYCDMEANKSNRDLYIIPVSGGEPKKIASGAKSEFNECWKPGTENKIAYLSNESGTTQLYETTIDGSGTVQVTKIDGGINSFLYNHNGTAIAYTQDVKLDQSIGEKYPDLPKAQAFATDDLMYRHWDNWHDYAYSHVFYYQLNGSAEAIDLLKGERFDSPLQPFGGIEHITFSTDGSKIIYTSKKKNGTESAKSTNSDLYQYEIASGKTTNITTGMMGYDQNPLFSHDGKYMAFQSMKREGNEADKNDIVLLETATGKKINLTEKSDQTSGSYCWSADNKFIYFISPYLGTEQIFEIDILKNKIRQVTSGDHDYVSVAVAGKFLVGGKQNMNMPTELFNIEIKTGKETQLTFVNKAVYDKLKVGKIEKKWITTSDGKKMLVWIILPADFDPSKKYPTLLYCQGGPQSTVSQFFSYRWNFQLMAAKGYVVVAPNRRGLPSFGQAWNDQISGDWGGQAIKDYLTAIDTACTYSYVDKTKLGAIGASYGGYSVYQLAGVHNGRFKTFISHCGLFNLESWYGSTEELFFANWDIGGPYWEKNRPKSYDDFSPHNFVGKWDTPILVIHGEKDFRVPFNQGMEAFQAARLKGIEARFLAFPNEGHWVLSPQNSMLWIREFYSWMDGHLK